MWSVNATAITNTAPMSSRIARVRTRIFKPKGTRGPSRARNPATKAISVAMGMAHPFAPGLPCWNARKIAAGTSMPPSAAATGNTVLRGSRSAPCTNSRLISRPTTKKKIVIAPSLIQCCNVSSNALPPTVSPTLVCQRPAKAAAQGELAIPSAMSAQARSTMPPAASILKNLAKGPASRLMIGSAEPPSGRVGLL